MDLFTEEDKDFSQRAKQSDWSPTPDIIEQFRKDFKNGNPTTEQVENHDDWKITGRRPTSISHSDGSRTEDAEILEATYRGDKDLENEVVSSIVPAEYSQEYKK